MPAIPRRGKIDWRSALAKFDATLARAPLTPVAAQLLQTKGLVAEAEAALREYLARFPQHHQSLLNLGMMLRRGGREQEAAEFLKRAAEIEASEFATQSGERDAIGQFLSAAEQCGVAPAEAPAAFVTAIFDRGADRFETLLRDQLQYRAPELLHAAFARVASVAPATLDILDIGCGTGLAGEVFRAMARRLDGIDLSANMLEKAAAKGIYQRLEASEIVTYLDTTADQYDLVLAADVLIYFGDLAPVFTAAHRVTRGGGWFAFTVEAGDGTEYYLQPVRRYAHSRDYLMRTALATGWIVQNIDETSTRVESFQPVRSYVCVVTKSI